MAGPADEAFVERHLHAGTVLDFGCQPGVFTSRIAQRSDLQVTGVDLYDPVILEGYTFIKGDVVHLPLPTFNTVCCVSSFEHCGLQPQDPMGYIPGELPDLEYHYVVAQRLASLVSPGGRLVLTCPFGTEGTWFVLADGRHLQVNHLEDCAGAQLQWGFRTFTVASLCALFPDFDLECAEAYELAGPHYSLLESWASVALDSYADYHNVRRAILGVSLRKR